MIDTHNIAIMITEDPDIFEWLDGLNIEGELVGPKRGSTLRAKCPHCGTITPIAASSFRTGKPLPIACSGCKQGYHVNFEAEKGLSGRGSGRYFDIP